MKQLLYQRCGTLRSCLEGIFWVLFAVLGFALSFSFDQPIANYSLGAAVWPRSLLLVLAVLGILLLVSRQSPSVTDNSSLTESNYRLRPLSRTALNRTLVFLLPLLYAWLMNLIGFLVVTPLFLATLIYFFGYRRPLTLIAVVSGFYLLILIVFVRLTYIPFPPGNGYFNTLNNQYIEWVRNLGREK